ncbi:glucan synthase [Capsulimonas corticalis]|uniref:Glucan synthase n=1 Tax=Capsulimonas corticalis TaxID=2219043 RepID=A0A402CW04_9BACT|nr:SMI1/KNR4 family protein [Capsulimonas corticalis]BDI33991.1 glucan synthase [Capsulimonas corticalis]
MTTINTSWERIEAWLGQNAPDILAGLASGATDAEIDAAEKVLGVEFPDDIRESYKRHNGQIRDKNYIAIGGPLYDYHDLLPLNGIAMDWRVWNNLLVAGTFDDIDSDPSPGIKTDWWNAKWIPLTSNGSGDHYCMDLDPAPGGIVGQIITMWHDAPEREVVARSFGEWIAQLAQDLEDGRQVYSEEYGGIVSVDDL